MPCQWKIILTNCLGIISQDIRPISWNLFFQMLSEYIARTPTFIFTLSNLSSWWYKREPMRFVCSFFSQFFSLYGVDHRPQPFSRERQIQMKKDKNLTLIFSLVFHTKQSNIFRRLGITRTNQMDTFIMDSRMKTSYMKVSKLHFLAKYSFHIAPANSIISFMYVFMYLHNYYIN